MWLVDYASCIYIYSEHHGLLVLIDALVSSSVHSATVRHGFSLKSQAACCALGNGDQQANAALMHQSHQDETECQCMLKPIFNCGLLI